jgi:hypothetical protein
VLRKLCGSQHTYESALEPPVIHVLDCELGDSFCVMEPLWKSTEYESASKHPMITILIVFHNVLDCEFEDSSCIMEPLWKSTKI